ncbi:hypothetical protein LOK49_LG09G00049 [Camellia lanceoleosa]|uniref:Uncharacterized protein n=1 Tax=Camellia lanceoleosa TaxID=1840588 RepID=A0ACC0GJW3_9ERIC|nr:hypothetical protein LOK49_LG09G00049 [Camellia lanceoleosa]
MTAVLMGHVIMGVEGQCHPVIIMDVGLVVVVVVGIGFVTLVGVIILVKKIPLDAQSCNANALSCPRFLIPLFKKCSISFGCMWVFYIKAFTYI